MEPPLPRPADDDAPETPSFCTAEAQGEWERLSFDLLAACLAPLAPDDRAAAASACASWRLAAASPSLWESLPLGGCRAAVRRRLADAELLELVSRAQAAAPSGLLHLDVSGCPSLSAAAVVAAAAAAGASLRSLVCQGAGSLLFSGREALRLDSACARLRLCSLGFEVSSVSGALMLLSLSGRGRVGVVNLRLVGLAQLSAGDAAALAAALRAEAPRLRLLSLRGCRLGDAAACALLQGLRGHGALTELDLGYAGLGAATAAALAAALAAACAGEAGLSLAGVSLDGNALFSAGAGSLATALACHGCPLRSLALRRCCLGVAGARALALALGASAGGLRELDLEENGVGDKGARELAAALAASSRLRASASLSHRLLEWAADPEAAEGPGGGCALDSLRLGRNAVSDEGARALAAALAAPGAACLRLLDLRQNEAASAGARALLAALETREARGDAQASVVLTGNCVPESFSAQLAASTAARLLLVADGYGCEEGAPAEVADKEEGDGEWVSLDFSLEPTTVLPSRLIVRRRRRRCLTALAVLIVLAAMASVFVIHHFMKEKTRGGGESHGSRG